MQEKMYHLWKEYKDSIDGLSTRYYAAMSSLKDIPEKIPGDQIKEQAPHISAQLEHKMAELGERFKEESSRLTDEFIGKMERLVAEHDDR